MDGQIDEQIGGFYWDYECVVEDAYKLSIEMGIALSKEEEWE